MQPVVMTLLLIVGWGAFAWSASRRWRLLRAGAPADRFDNPGERLHRMGKFALGQWRMPRHRVAGIAHIFIFAGAAVMLIRGLIMFSRGFTADPHFGFWIFDTDHAFGQLYSLAKDLFIVLVLLGIAVFFYFRAIRRLSRMTIDAEGFLILGILSVLMLSDVLYDGANLAVHGQAAAWGEPLGGAVASLLSGAGEGTQLALMHVGFWLHIVAILGFLNYLPYCKQFHEITAIPNVYFQRLDAPGRLAKMDDLEGMVEREETLGVKQIQQFSWKAMLDFYSCTECGRCSAACPATRTGKKLSPKHLTLDLRDFAYQHQSAIIADAKHRRNGNGDQVAAATAADATDAAHRIDLTDGVIDPEVLWGCTTCRACEVECPVFISYVDKIVDMRRYLVQEKGEFPQDLTNAFRGLESSGNPWNLPPARRMEWAEGLEVPTLEQNPEPEWLLWIGCAPAFEERAKKIARATTQLLNKAGVNYAIIGKDEQCNGDAARRAGNEFLYQIMAQANIEIFNELGIKKIITLCPHCYNTFKNEYPDFGGVYEVIHHTQLLAQLVREGKLKPTRQVKGRVVYHDACYLGRHNDEYDAPRNVLASVPGLEILEIEDSRDRGMCCGAGGAQFFKEEEPGDDRVSYRRTDQLLEAKPDVISSACPFCMTMLGDGLAAREVENVRQKDVSELLLEAIE